jgi:hypothetical protein
MVTATDRRQVSGVETPDEAGHVARERIGEL